LSAVCSFFPAPLSCSFFFPPFLVLLLVVLAAVCLLSVCDVWGEGERERERGERVSGGVGGSGAVGGSFFVLCSSSSAQERALCGTGAGPSLPEATLLPCAQATGATATAAKGAREKPPLLEGERGKKEGESALLLFGARKRPRVAIASP
jgi:hypothetical protein